MKAVVTNNPKTTGYPELKTGNITGDIIELALGGIVLKFDNNLLISKESKPKDFWFFEMEDLIKIISN